MQTTVVVASGSAVSDPFGARGLGNLSILAPTVNSCQIFLQASTDTTSANFRRVRVSTNPATEWAWPVSSNAAAVSVGADMIGAFPLIRLETGVAQTDARSFSVFTSRQR